MSASAAVLAFGAAMPLAIWAATVYRRLRTLGVTAPGGVIGLAGGILAAASIALSGLLSWVAADTAAGFVVPLALLIAGVAVLSLILRLTPRPLDWTGLVIAAAGMLSTLTLLIPALNATLPIGRFGGLVWIVAVSVLLPATRHQVPAGAGRAAPAVA